MCCEPKGHSGRHHGMGHYGMGHHGMGHHSCCCCPPGFFRRFESSKERRERLEEYKAQLESELAGVNERIQELKD